MTVFFICFMGIAKMFCEEYSRPGEIENTAGVWLGFSTIFVGIFATLWRDDLWGRDACPMISVILSILCGCLGDCLDLDVSTDKVQCSLLQRPK